MSAKTVLVCDICKVEADAFQTGGTIPEGWVPAAIRGSMIEHVCPKCHLLFQDWCASVAGGVNYKTFRDALTEISIMLKMPGSPDLAHDVPKEVERRLGELAQVEQWKDEQPVDPINVDCSQCGAKVAQFCKIEGQTHSHNISGSLIPPCYHEARKEKAKQIGIGVPTFKGFSNL